ncbi:hypothetical protein PV326_000361, partial [Microctonus aethiopoides]
VLSASLENVIKRPSKKIISKNLPLCFEGFENVRVVLDCTEIFVQQPSELCCQLLTHSTYKNGQVYNSPGGSDIFDLRKLESMVFSGEVIYYAYIAETVFSWGLYGFRSAAK